MSCSTRSTPSRISRGPATHRDGAGCVGSGWSEVEPTQPWGAGRAPAGAGSPRPLLPRLLEVVEDRVAPTTLSKRTLTDLCHTLEDQVLVEDLDATVVSGFQRARYWAVERDRYEAMVADPRRRAIVFTADADEQASTVRHIVVGEEHDLAREWFVLALTSGFSAALFGRELVGAQQFDERERQFLTIWSFDPIVVADLAEIVLASAADLDPDDVNELRAALQAIAPRVPEPLMVQRFTNAVFERLETGQQRLASAAHARDAAHRELAQRKDRSIDLERYATLSKVAAQVAHQLQDPLAAIATAAATVSDAVDPEERTRLAGIIETEALRAGQFAGELQALSSTEPATLEPVELVGWLQREIDEHRRRGQEVELEDLPGPVTQVIDAVRLRGALSAVLGDAQAAPGRSRPPRVGVEVTDGGTGIAVRRDGTAPDVALRRMIADPVGSGATSDGSMLDLTLASAHLHHQGGALTINVDEQVTTYRLELFADTPAADDNPERDHEPADTPQGAQRVALIVDDEPAIRGLVEALLRRAGWMVHAANGAEEARRATREQPFDAVLLDIPLGGGDGRELLTELEQLRPGTAERTAIITGDPPASASLHGRPVVGKPLVWAELRAALEELTAQAADTPNGESGV